MLVPMSTRTLKQRLNKFSAEKLAACLDHIFGVGSWENVKKHAENNNLDLTNTQEIVHYVLAEFEAKQPSHHLRMQTSLNVLGFELVWDFKSGGVWYGAVFHEKTPKHSVDLNNFKNNILKAYEEHGINADAIIFAVGDDVICITIAPRNTKKGKVTYGDTFSIYLDVRTFLTEDLIVVYLPPSSQTKPFIDHLEIMVSGLGFGSCERLKLHGCNVDTLFSRICDYQEKEKARPVQTKEKALTVQTKEKAMPVQTKEKAMPVQTEEKAMPVQTKEKAMPVQTKEKAMPVQTKEKAMPVQTKEKAMPVLTYASFQIPLPAEGRTEADYAQRVARNQHWKYGDRVLPPQQNAFSDYRVTAVRTTGDEIVATMEINTQDDNPSLKNIIRSLIYHGFLDMPTPTYVEGMPIEYSNDVLIQPSFFQERSLEAEDRDSNKSNKNPDLQGQEFCDE